MNEIEYKGWIIRHNPIRGGWRAKCFHKADIDLDDQTQIFIAKPKQEFEDTTQESVIALAKTWCDKNIPF